MMGFKNMLNPAGGYTRWVDDGIMAILIDGKRTFTRKEGTPF